MASSIRPMAVSQVITNYAPMRSRVSTSAPAIISIMPAISMNVWHENGSIFIKPGAR